MQFKKVLLILVKKIAKWILQRCKVNCCGNPLYQAANQLVSSIQGKLFCFGAFFSIIEVSVQPHLISISIVKVMDRSIFTNEHLNSLILMALFKYSNNVINTGNESVSSFSEQGSWLIFQCCMFFFLIIASVTE